MSTESYEILMPEKARVMTEEEMEYEGGWLNFVAGLAATAIGFTASALGSAGLISKKDAEFVSNVCTVVSIATMGVSLCAVAKVGTAVVKGTSSVVLRTASHPIRGVKTPVSDAVGSCIISASSDIGGSIVGAAGNAALKRRR